MDWEYARFSSGVAYDGIGCNWVMFPHHVRENYTDPTLMATRLFCCIRTNANQTGGAGFAGMGLIAWDHPDDSLPTFPNLPGVLDYGDLDWIVRFVATIPQDTAAGTLVYNNFDTTHLSKARRRLGNQTSLLFCVEGSNNTGGSNMAADVRCLIKE